MREIWDVLLQIYSCGMQNTKLLESCSHSKSDKLAFRDVYQSVTGWYTYILNEYNKILKVQ